MKKSLFLALCVSVFAISIASCKEEKKVKTTPPVVEEPKAPEVYTPVNQSVNVDVNTSSTYVYYPAPTNQVANSVRIDYDEKTPYAKPIIITYTYDNADTYTYIIPQEFGLWENEAGKLRVISDEECTVWLQGQTKDGKFHEFIFYGNPKFNGRKIKPNSYLNHPSGLIKYRK
jgi:hypothetical protein